MFLTLIVVGLVGLVMMAIPALGGHGRGHFGTLHGHGGSTGHAGHGYSIRGHHSHDSDDALVVADSAPEHKLGFIPSPHAIFSFLALYGAFGNALLRAGHCSQFFSALAALAPALIVERFLIRPLFSLLFRFQARPSSPLDALVFADARAVVPFRNGRGVVSVNRDGRLIQLSARLLPAQTPQARADAAQNVIQQEAEGRAQATRIRAIAEAEADAIRMKAQALLESGGAYLDLRRLEMAPELTREIASALASSQFVNFGTSGGAAGEHGAVSTGSDDVLRVVQTLMAAQVITGGKLPMTRTEGPPIQTRAGNPPPPAPKPAKNPA